MDIFSVPVEVVDAYVLPYLEWNDLLRLRRVCKWTKAITDGYLKVHPELAPEIEITGKQEGRGLGAFMEMGIPTTRIFLNNTSGDQFYEDAREDIDEFLEDYGGLVRFLRVDQLSLLIMGQEWKFLEGLKNLESLEADCCGGYRRGLNPEEASEVLLMKFALAREDPNMFRNRKYKFPIVLASRLKSIKVRNTNGVQAVIDRLIAYNGCFMIEGKKLTSIAFPFSPDAVPYVTSPLYGMCDSPLGNEFMAMVTYMFDRRRSPPLPDFKEIDFSSYHHRMENLLDQLNYEWTASRCFLGFCDECFIGSVKLLNVASTWFVARKVLQNPVELARIDRLGVPILSLVNLHPSVLSLNLLNLGRIEIKSTSRSSPGPDWRNERQDWPSLKTLDITVDSVRSEYFDWSERLQRAIISSTRTMELLDFFFVGVSRTAMTELRLDFSGGAGTVAIPNTEHIAASCPNLKKLTLINWSGTNKSLTKLWSGLPGLEEVSLEKCKALGNVAFVGEDVGAPVFLKLKKLRKLSLKGLDQMPKITDTLFSLVIRHLELTHLTLTSKSPLNSITAAGVRLLCDGKFAGSIQKFPFKDWSLSNVSAEEFQKLEAMFRSSKML